MRFRASALICLALGACSRHAPEQASVSFVDVSGGARIETSGITIELGPSVRFRSESTFVGGRSTTSSTVNGYPFGVRDGRFFVGPNDYGPVASGSMVHLASDGVLVDGVPRGALPQERFEFPDY